MKVTDNAFKQFKPAPALFIHRGAQRASADLKREEPYAKFMDLILLYALHIGMRSARLDGYE